VDHLTHAHKFVHRGRVAQLAQVIDAFIQLGPAITTQRQSRRARR
jgi:hypothetical protein